MGLRGIRMSWLLIHTIVVFLQHCVSTAGIVVILFGVTFALGRYIYYLISGRLLEQGSIINEVRLSLGRTLILGLEFIVAADLIGTTTTPDYYAVGLLAIIVVIRTLLSFSLNRELMALSKENQIS